MRVPNEFPGVVVCFSSREATKGAANHIKPQGCDLTAKLSERKGAAARSSNTWPHEVSRLMEAGNEGSGIEGRFLIRYQSFPGAPKAREASTSH